MIRTLRRTFVAVILSIATLMLAVIFVMVCRSTARQLETESLQMMQTIARRPLDEDRLRGASEGVYLPYFVIQTDPFGGFVAAGSKQFDLQQDYLRRVIGAVAKQNSAVGVLPEENLRYLRTERGMSTVLVFLDMSAEHNTLSSLARTCLCIGLAAVAAFFLLAVLLARWVVKPVERAWQQQRQFVADASHELKTPLTVIMTNAELMQDASIAPEEKDGFAGNVLSMSYRMRYLVEQLLDLTRADNGIAAKNFAPTDLSALTEDALLPFEPVYFEKGLTLHSHVEEELRVNGDETRLKQVTEILLDNAAKYAQENTWVQVVLRKQAAACVLSVATPGEALSKEDLKNIFKRFYRVDKARSDGSYGLGLSIAESIVKEHRGKIWAESDGGVNTFYVSLPALG